LTGANNTFTISVDGTSSSTITLAAGTYTRLALAQAAQAEINASAPLAGRQVAVVLDGRPLDDVPEGVHDGVLVAYATRGGRNAADDRIVAEVERDRDPASLVVVTSDRALAARVRALGAGVEGAGTLLAQLDATRDER